MKQMILEVKESTYLGLLDNGSLDAMVKSKMQWPQESLRGTEPKNNKRLILIMSHLEKEELEDWFGGKYPIFDEEGNEQFIDFGFKWKVAAVEGEAIQPNKLLKYFSDVPLYNESGEIIDFEPVTDLTGKIQTYAGHMWTYD